jgi:hypothetical protein
MGTKFKGFIPSFGIKKKIFTTFMMNREVHKMDVLEFSPKTPVLDLRKELEALKKKQHQEWLEVFHRLQEKMAKVAKTCEHDWCYICGMIECSKCGISREYYRSRRWESD